MAGRQFRENRLRAGLTLRAVARATGTAESTLPAYERGARKPNAPTVRRLEAAFAPGQTSPVFTQHLLTVSAAAAALRSGLRADWSTSDLLRLVREMRSNSRLIESAADRDLFLAEPPTTGDRRWDTMLAGNVEELAGTMGADAPSWTQGHALPEFWFVGSMPEFEAYSFGYSPFSLQLRGIMIDPSDLESV